MTGVLMKGRNLGTGMHTGKMSCEFEGKDQAHNSTKQGISKMANLQK